MKHADGMILREISIIKHRRINTLIMLIAKQNRINDF